MEQMEAGSEDRSGSEDGLSGMEDEGEDEDEESEDDEETVEKKAKIRQFTSEIKALETAIEKKRAGFTGGNPIMMVS
jgi:transcription initiation factor TFIID subunit 7